MTEPHQPRLIFLHSIVVPVYNEEESIRRFAIEIIDVAAKIQDQQVEIIFVNDGSTDRTAQLIGEFIETDTRFKVIHLSRNFGHQAALWAGLSYARGDTVTTIDADLQDNPKVILEMIEKWRAGFEIVHAARYKRAGETFHKKFFAACFYLIFKLICDFKFLIHQGDFRLMDRKAVDALLSLSEKNMYNRGLVSWLGFRQTSVYFSRNVRTGGKSHYNVRKMTQLALDGITAFSMKPLRIIVYLGVFMFSVGLMAAPILTYYYFKSANNDVILIGIFDCVALVGGIQLICLGIVSEYLAKVLSEVRGRPRFIVDEIDGFERPLREGRRATNQSDLVARSSTDAFSIHF